MAQVTATTERAVAPAVPSGRGAHARGQARTGVLMALPALLLVALFTLYPFGQAIYESTRLSSPIFEPRFVGLENFVGVLTSSYFRAAALTTLLFAGVTVPLLIGLGVLVALLLNERFWGNTALRAGMLLPWAIPASAAGVIWQWVFFDSFGALNAGLYSLGIIDQYVEWLTTPNLARMAVVIVGSSGAFGMVIRSPAEIGRRFGNRFGTSTVPRRWGGSWHSPSRRSLTGDSW